MAQKRKRNRSWISWVFIFALLVAACVVCYLVWDNYFNEKQPDNEGTQEQVIEEEKKTEETETEEKTESVSEEDEKKTIQYEGDDPNLKEELSGSVTYAGKIDNKITIRLNIDQYLNNGNCELHLMNNGAEVYGDTTRIIGSASTATCEGFDIPATNIGNGKYDIVINIFSGEKKGTIKGEINI